MNRCSLNHYQIACTTYAATPGDLIQSLAQMLIEKIYGALPRQCYPETRYVESRRTRTYLITTAETTHIPGLIPLLIHCDKKGYCCFRHSAIVVSQIAALP